MFFFSPEKIYLVILTCITVVVGHHTRVTSCCPGNGALVILAISRFRLCWSYLYLRSIDCFVYLLYPQQQDLSMVMNLLNIKQHLARTLLIHHRWKMHCIYDHLDRKGRDRMLSEACIILPKNSMSAASSTSVTCNVCFEDFPMTDVSTMDCGHCFCNDCESLRTLQQLPSDVLILTAITLL